MIEEMEIYAKKFKIPIMEKAGIDFLTNYIKKNGIRTILEIGSAIGYSAIKMALVNRDIKIVTIERDPDRYREAIKNIQKCSLDKQIKVIESDAFDVHLEQKFDLIFIDAAKSQSTKFFQKFQNNLNEHGVIVTDNIYFHGLTYSDDIKSKNLRQMTKKIREYVEFLKENKEFKTEILDIGDGIAISVKI